MLICTEHQYYTLDLFQELLSFYFFRLYKEGKTIICCWSYLDAAHLIIAAKALPWDRSFFLSYFNQYLSHNVNTKQPSAEEHSRTLHTPAVEMDHDSSAAAKAVWPIQIKICICTISFSVFVLLMCFNYTPDDIRGIQWDGVKTAAYYRKGKWI